MSQYQHRLPANFIPRSPAAVALTSAQKAAITRKANLEAQRLRDEALIANSLKRGERSAMSKAKQNQVWMDENTKKRRRAKSDAAQPPVVRKAAAKRTKVAAPRVPKFDDINDDEPSGNVAPLRSTLQKKVGSTRRAPPSKVSELNIQGSSGTTQAEKPAASSQDWAAEVIGALSPKTDTDDEQPSYDSDDNKAQSRACDSGADSDFAAEEDELIDSDPAFDQPTTWTPMGEMGESDQESVHGKQVNDSQALLDSDDELEYANAHGLSKLIRLKRRTNAASLFETDEGVTNARATSHRSKERSQSSKREQKRRSEEANWKGPKAVKSRLADNTKEPSHSGESLGSKQTPDDAPSPPAQPAHTPQQYLSSSVWPAATEVAVTSHGNLALNQSTADVRRVFHTAEEQMKRLIVLNNAYPDIDARSKIIFLSDTLVLAAWEVKCGDIADRLQADNSYARILMDALSTRLSQFRGKFRTSATAKVGAYFGLKGAAGDIAKRVEDLLEKKRYIYPVGLSENMAKTRPYENGIITEVIQEVLITRNRNLIQDNMVIFRVDWQGDELYELPVAVIALAATAVHAALLNYRARGLQPTDFSADQYSAIYNTHATVLSGIQEQKPGAYHRLLKKLFEDVIGSSTVTATRADADEILGDLDFDNLDA